MEIDIPFDKQVSDIQIYLSINYTVSLNYKYF